MLLIKKFMNRDEDNQIHTGKLIVVPLFSCLLQDFRSLLYDWVTDSLCAVRKYTRGGEGCDLKIHLSPSTPTMYIR